MPGEKRKTRSCVECAFIHSQSDGSPYGPRRSLPQDTRDKIRAGKPYTTALWCYQKVWGCLMREGPKANEIDKLLTKDRGDTCLFYPDREGVAPAAAKEFERREDANRERTLVKKGLWLTFGAFVVALIVGFTGAADRIATFLVWIGTLLKG